MKSQTVKILETINVYTALMEYWETRDINQFAIYRMIVKDLKALL